MAKNKLTWKGLLKKYGGDIPIAQNGGENDPYSVYGGMDNYSKMLDYANYQRALQSGNQDMVDFYNALNPEFAKMSYNDAYRLSRDMSYLAYDKDGKVGRKTPFISLPTNDKGQPIFVWNPKKGDNISDYQPYSIEADDDSIFEWRSPDEIDVIYDDINNNVDYETFISNQDLESPQDYYEALQEFYKDDPEKRRLLRDIKEKNPEQYLSMFDVVNQSSALNLLRKDQNREFQEGHQVLNEGIDTRFSGGFDPNTGAWMPAVESTAIYQPPTVSYFESDDELMLKNLKTLKQQKYLKSSDFNKKGGYYDFSEDYDPEQLAEFQENYAKQFFMMPGENEDDDPVLDKDMWKMFQEYTPGSGNQFFDAIISGRDNVAGIYDLDDGVNAAMIQAPDGFFGTEGKWHDLRDYSTNNPHFVKDYRMALLNEDNFWRDGDFNYRENRPKNWYERNISDRWNRFGNYLKNDVTNNDAINFILGDIGFGTLDWAGDILRPAIFNNPATGFMMRPAADAIGLPYNYEAGQRFMENPNWSSGANIGFDAVSFLPVGRGAKLLTQGLNKGKFATQGLRLNQPLSTNYNLMKGNLKDYSLLKNIKNFDDQYPGLMRDQLGNRRFTINSPNVSGRQYSFGADDFNTFQLPIPSGVKPKQNFFDPFYAGPWGSMRARYLIPGYTGVSLTQPEGIVNESMLPTIGPQPEIVDDTTPIFNVPLVNE